MMPDLFDHFLTGRSVAEYTIASTSQCLDPIRARLGRGPAAGADGHPQPASCPRSSRRARTSDRSCPKWPRTRRRGSTRVVAPGSHDTASAVVGAPLAVPATAFLSSGTWSLIGLEVAAPVLSDAALAANLTNEGGVAGTIRLLRNVARAVARPGEPARNVAVATTPRRTRSSPRSPNGRPPSRAFIDPDDERFLRPGDLPARVRAFCRETGQPPPEEPGTLFRVLLESLALRYADGGGRARRGRRPTDRGDPHRGRRDATTSSCAA